MDQEIERIESLVARHIKVMAAKQTDTAKIVRKLLKDMGVSISVKDEGTTWEYLEGN